MRNLQTTIKQIDSALFCAVGMNMRSTAGSGTFRGAVVPFQAAADTEEYAAKECTNRGFTYEHHVQNN